VAQLREEVESKTLAEDSKLIMAFFIGLSCFKCSFALDNLSTPILLLGQWCALC
jgi:hypothetical protein